MEKRTFISFFGKVVITVIFQINFKAYTHPNTLTYTFSYIYLRLFY